MLDQFIEKGSALAVTASVYAFGDYGLSSVLASTGALAGVAFARHERMNGEYQRVFKATRSKVEAAYSNLDTTEDDKLAIAQMSDLIAERADALSFDPTELAAVAREEGRFETNAAAYILSKLKITEADAKRPVAFQFAQSVLVHSLEAARENESFYQPLQLELLFGIRQDVAAMRADLIARNQTMAEELGLAKGLLFGVVRSYTPDDPSNFDDAVRSVERALRVAKEERDALALPSNLPDAVTHILARVAELNETDRMDEATALLEAEIAASEDREAEEQATRLRLLRRAVAQAIETGNEPLAVGSELKRIDLETSDPVTRFSALRSVQDEWYARGLRLGLRFDLDVSIRLAEAMLGRSASRWERYAALNDLANSLQDQGTRTGGAEGAALLARAVEAYEAALEITTKADHPVDWAGTQNNLGNALSDQATRTGGAEGTALFARAVEAYEAALEIRTKADHPVDWAVTQNNLGAALDEQATRTGGAEGTALFDHAVEAYEAALEIRTKADHPAHWAMTQNNLGVALAGQGIRTGGAEGTALLARAVEAYEAALEIRSKADHPAHWAMTQENIAITMKDWAALDPSGAAAHLGEALQAVGRALEVYDPVNMSYDHGTATELRDEIQAKLAALEGGKG